VIIERVELVNFLSHRHTVVRFEPGITVIIGPNGAGKTSIVDAITYTLFDEHSRGRSKDSLVRLGAAAARVTVEFKVGNRLYQVQRTIPRGRGAATAQLYELTDGRRRLLAHGVRSVRRELERILGLKTSLAALLYVTRQGELEALLSNKQSREQIINTVFGFDKMDTAYRRMLALIKEFAGRRDVLRERLEALKRDIDSIRAKEKRLRELEARLETLRSEVARLEAAYREAKAAVEELEQLEKAKLALESRLAPLREQLASLERQLARVEEQLREAEKAQRELSSFNVPQEELLPTIDEALRLAQEAARLHERLEALKSRLDDLNARLARMRELEEKAARYQEVAGRIEELREQATRYEQLKREVEAGEEKLTRLKRQYEEAMKRVLSVLRRFQTIHSIDLSDPSKIDEHLAWLMDTLNSQLEKLREEIKELEKKVSALEERRKQIGDANDKLSSAHGRCPVCGRPLSEEERLQLIKKFREDLAKIEADIVHLNRKLYLKNKELRELEERMRRLEAVRRSVQRYLATAEKILQDMSELKAETDRLKKSLLELQPAYNEYRLLIEEKAVLEEAWREYLKLQALREEAERVKSEASEVSARLEELWMRLSSLLAKLGIEGVDDPNSVVEELSMLRDRVARLAEKARLVDELSEERMSILESIEAVRERVEQAEAELARLEERLASLRGARGRLEEVEGRLEGARAELHRVEGEVSHLKGEVARLEALLENARRTEELLRRYEKAVQVLERIRTALHPDRGAPQVLRRQAKSVMEYYLRQILERFELDFLDVRLEDDYSLVLVTPEGQKTVDMLSGGERVASAIAFRLALAKAAAGSLESMIMDEPTVHLDEDRRRELVNIIRYSLDAARLVQLIVITHDREVEEAADHVIEVRRGEGGASRVEARSATAPGGLGVLEAEAA